jgi:NADH-quinone oxidoreductase subunit G
MPTITINGKTCQFKPGQMILQVANDHGIAIPQYCYHDGLSIVASCRICLGEAFAPDKTGKLAPFMGGKLFPTCQTPAADGMVVYTDSPKAVQNQKAVMEYLLINHPLDCPVCDQAGECYLQDYSYQYGRGVSRFEEDKVKQPKKDVGPHVLLYADRCIMCTRCVRFTREVSGTGELMVAGRGNRTEIDVFPGAGIDNPLSANVIDLCPVGALLDKDFLFAQRVWYLKSTPGIDPLTASGDNIWIEHNEGRLYRIKPRINMDVNRWWITDEVRYGWKFVHADGRLRSPMRRRFGALVESDYNRAYEAAVEGLREAARGGRIALVASPMLPCEEAYALALMARAIDPQAVLAVGPVPRQGQDQHFPPDAPPERAYRVYAEKAPNARGVRRVLEAIGGPKVLSYDEFASPLANGAFRGVILTGNYPGPWADEALLRAVSRAGERPGPAGAGGGGGRPFTVLIDTLSSRLVDEADVVLPGASFAEKAGTFESAAGMIQAFEAAIPVIELAKPEGQIALDLLAALRREAAAAPFPSTVETPAIGMEIPATTTVAPPRGRLFNPAVVRQEMASQHPKLAMFVSEVRQPRMEAEQGTDVQVVEL